MTRPVFVTSRRAIDGTYCRECGGSMFIDQAGVSHHGSPEKISYDDDNDHDAVAEEETEMTVRDLSIFLIGSTCGATVIGITALFFIYFLECPLTEMIK